jgi:hypothetical protein
VAHPEFAEHIDNLVGRPPMTGTTSFVERPECEPPPAATRAVS